MADVGMFPFSDIAEADLGQILKLYLFSKDPSALEALSQALPASYPMLSL